MDIRTMISAGGMARKLGLMARGNAGKVLDAIPESAIIAARTPADVAILKAAATQAYDGTDVDESRQYSFGSIVRWIPGESLDPTVNVLDDANPLTVGRWGLDDAEKLERPILVTRVSFRVVFDNRETYSIKPPLPLPCENDYVREWFVGQIKAGVFFCSIGVDRKREFCKGSIGDFMDGHHLHGRHWTGVKGTMPGVDQYAPDVQSRDDGVASSKDWQSPFPLPAGKVVNLNLRGPYDALSNLQLPLSADNVDGLVLLVSSFQGIILD
jgi:hypothetical protein